MRYFLAALSALVLVLPAGSTVLATKHYFTVVNNTGSMPNCPPVGLQVKCSTETTWQSPPWTMHMCEEGADLEYRDKSWENYVYRPTFRTPVIVGQAKRTVAWQCDKPADLADETVRRTQVVTISGKLGAYGCWSADAAQSSCVFHCATTGGWRDCDYQYPVRPKGSTPPES